MARTFRTGSHWSRAALGLSLGMAWVAATVDASSKDLSPSPRPRAIDFSFLTYNVAGLPSLFSPSDPERHYPIISNLLNFYDIAAVQEDFVYHDALSLAALHPFRSEPLLPAASVGLGDGLSSFSRLPFTGFSRVRWRDCSGRFSDGSDCLTAKGFTMADYHLEPDVALHVYNLHMDAGRAKADAEARAAQIEQLIEALAERSRGKAVIVAGDTNIGAADEGLLEMLLDRAGLVDACRSLSCRAPHLVDRVMYRGTSSLDLRALRWEIDPRFVREDGRDLSDHKAVGVLFRYRRKARK